MIPRLASNSVFGDQRQIQELNMSGARAGGGGRGQGELWCDAIWADNCVGEEDGSRSRGVFRSFSNRDQVKLGEESRQKGMSSHKDLLGIEVHGMTSFGLETCHVMISGRSRNLATRERTLRHHSLLPGRPTLPRTGPGPHPHLRSTQYSTILTLYTTLVFLSPTSGASKISSVDLNRDFSIQINS